MVGTEADGHEREHLRESGSQVGDKTLTSGGDGLRPEVPSAASGNSSTSSMGAKRRVPTWLKPGVLVIAKVDGCPRWPGYIGVCEEEGGGGAGGASGGGGSGWKRHNAEMRRTYVWVMFLNSYTGDWVDVTNVVKFSHSVTEDVMNSDYNLASLKERLELYGAIKEAFDRESERERPLTATRKADEKICEGDLVLATYDAFPPWPALVERSSDDDDHLGEWCVKNKIYCKFLGEVKYNWVSQEKLVLYTTQRRRQSKVRNDNILFSEYMAAVDEAEEIIMVRQAEKNMREGRSCNAAPAPAPAAAPAQTTKAALPIPPPPATVPAPDISQQPRTLTGFDFESLSARLNQ